MILDKTRMDAYVRALRAAVRPGSVVADLGTGTGIFALLACQFGAARVYAIEPAAAIGVASEIAAANGYVDRITFFQKLSTEVELPEKVDLIVSDMRGVLPLLENHIPSIVDARQRFLKPEGILIPGRDRILAAPVEAAALHRRFITPWDRERYGLEMDAALKIVVNTWTGARLRAGQFLASPATWIEIDYASVERSSVAGTITWTIERPGSMHGVGMWFDTTLLEDVSFTSLSDTYEMVYSNAFFPFPTEVTVEQGDRVAVSLRADLTGDDYQWTWRTSVFSPNNPESPRVDFKQSTFQGIPLSRASLRHRRMDYSPGLSADGAIAQLALQLMGEGKSMEAITEAVFTKNPGRFLNSKQAFSHVVRLAERYGQSE